MLRHWSLLFWLMFASTGFAQTLNSRNLAGILNFENSRPGRFPTGWDGGPVSTIQTDNQVVHSGNYSARIDRNAFSPEEFSVITATIPIDFVGKTIEWRGFIKAGNVNGFVALWLREDGDDGTVEFASLQGLNLHGTMDWTDYSISVSWRPEGKKLYFGFLLSGTGTGWVDDLSLLVDGKPVALAEERRDGVLGTDREFDGGSLINVTSLSNIQVKNLSTLAKVWGFLKYHHPAITSGGHHWDYELFRIIPRVLNASDQAAANASILNWIAGLGGVEECMICARLSTRDLYLAPDLDWIYDESRLGADLSRILQNIYRNRDLAAEQFYVSLTPNVLNPIFENELRYDGLQSLDSGYRLLSLFRYWNMVQYFYPNRDIMADDPAGSPDYWNNVLEEFIPRIGLAADSLTFKQELIKFIAKINDTHANLWSSIDARPPMGKCLLPVAVRFVEGRPIVYKLLSSKDGGSIETSLRVGDLIEKLDGVPVEDLINQWRPFYADSNEAARMRDIGDSLTMGNCGAASVAIQRGDEHMSLTSDRVSIDTVNLAEAGYHDKPGSAFQMISDEIAYLKISSARTEETPNYIQAAAGTKGLILDLRNYPSDFVLFELGSHLVSEQTAFVQFTGGNITNPGAFYWQTTNSLTPQQPLYSGKVVILVDEVTQSSAEYHAMAFQSVPGALVIGSTTAGADGNVSRVPLPGGLHSFISGIGIFYPDKRPTQRIGIVPDIEVKPTIEGIRAGRDELIERAVQVLLAKSDLDISLQAGGTGVVSTVEKGSTVRTGYATASIKSGDTPYGVAVFSSSQNGVTVSETAVPASPPTTSARIFIEYRSGVPAVPGRVSAGTIDINTGIAVVSDNNSPTANVTYTLRDIQGAIITSGSGTIQPGHHFAKFINQFNETATGFELPADFPTAIQFATLEIRSDQPLAVVALRMTANQRNEVLYTTTPVADLTQAPNSDPVYFAQFADGGGYTSSLILLNTSDAAETGVLQILDDYGAPLVVNQVGGSSGSTFNYSIPAGGVFLLRTDGSPEVANVGWVTLTPDYGTSSPVGAGVFGYNPDNFLIMESGIPSAVLTTHARIYVDLSGRHNTGLAVANPTLMNSSLTITAFQSDGKTEIGTSGGPLELASMGHAARFADQLVDALPAGFKGVLDIASPTPFAALTMRSLYNERGDFLAATFPIADMARPAPSPIIFPQIADGGGYRTQFVFIGANGESSAALSIRDEEGMPLAIGNDETP